MIRKVSFRNFKAYRSLDLELEPFTVLVGPNASGKTTLLEGLQNAAELAAFGIHVQGDWDWSGPHIQSIHSYGTSLPVEFGLSGEWLGVPGTVRVTAGAPREVPPGRVIRKLVGMGEWGNRRFSTQGAKGWAEEQPGSGPALESLWAALTSTTVLRFEPRRLSEASYSEDVVPQVRSDGGGLASVLAHLKLSQDEVFSEIELALKQVVPTVRRIRIERAPVEQTVVRTLSLDNQSHEVPEKRTLWGHQVVLDMRGAKGVPASAAGEGTLMALGLLAVLMGPRRPRVVLLDDIEMALHPAAQGMLIKVLRKVQERDPELQIVATSHSPFVLNFLKPEEVRMSSLAENGFARCEPMTSHPDFERWKDLMSPGEFWSTVGESWMHNPQAPSGQGEPATHE
jgi:energy-coupling factor transporter ATP-binding protein EcfA2